MRSKYVHIAAKTTGTVEEAQQRHNTWYTDSVALGESLTEEPVQIEFKEIS